mgnify:CR=1 FL=1
MSEQQAPQQALRQTFSEMRAERMQKHREALAKVSDGTRRSKDGRAAQLYKRPEQIARALGIPASETGGEIAAPKPRNGWARKKPSRAVRDYGKRERVERCKAVPRNSSLDGAEIFTCVNQHGRDPYLDALHARAHQDSVSGRHRTFAGTAAARDDYVAIAGGRR